jgi:hypothetical protein
LVRDENDDVANEDNTVNSQLFMIIGHK